MIVWPKKEKKKNIRHDHWSWLDMKVKLISEWHFNNQTNALYDPLYTHEVK